MKSVNFIITVKYFFIFACILMFVRCSKLSGVYSSDDLGLVESISFSKDGTCIMRDSIMGFQTSYQYKIKGKTVIISSGEGVATLSVLSDTRLMGMGLPFSPGQIFIKEGSVENVSLDESSEAPIETAGNPAESAGVTKLEDFGVFQEEAPPANAALPGTSAETQLDRGAAQTELSFPKEFIGTWKRENYNNTLTITKNTITISSRTHTWELLNVSDDLYTLKRSGVDQFTLPIGLINNILIISGDTGTGQENWNGNWLRQ